MSPSAWVLGGLLGAGDGPAGPEAWLSQRPEGKGIGPRDGHVQGQLCQQGGLQGPNERGVCTTSVLQGLGSHRGRQAVGETARSARYKACSVAAWQVDREGTGGTDGAEGTT